MGRDCNEGQLAWATLRLQHFPTDVQQLRRGFRRHLSQLFLGQCHHQPNHLGLRGSVTPAATGVYRVLRFAVANGVEAICTCEDTTFMQCFTHVGGLDVAVRPPSADRQHEDQKDVCP